MTDETFRFARPRLAQEVCDAVASPMKTSAELFLAARRRTGKTFFLLNDLTPEAESREWCVVYVDLWRSSSKGTLVAIKQAIQSALRAFESQFRRFVNERVTKISIGKILSLDLSEVDDARMSITDMLETLGQATDQPILLILDEAQQTLSDPDGLTALAELKAAREILNRAGAQKHLLMLFTGSHRDKLSRLVSSNKMPLLGQEVGDFPMLGAAFSHALADFVNARLAEHYEGESIEQAMAIVGRRPVAVWRAIDRISWPIIGQTSDRRPDETVNQALIRVAVDIRDEAVAELSARIEDLTPMARALLWRIIGAKGSLAPFSEASRRSLADEIGQSAIASNNQVQSAIETLRQTDLVWSPGRGVYLLEDEGHVKAWAEAQGDRGPDGTGRNGPSV